MSKEQEKLEVKVDYAYAVLRAVAEGMDRVAAKPELYRPFMVEFLKAMPVMIDALEVIVKEEHKPIFAEFLRANSRMVGAWIKAKKP